MLKIGDFSKLAMVSVRMLRYYDDQNILSPAHTDPFTGYRYYNVKQLSEISSIKLLQRMGVSLSDIRALKQNGYDKDEILSVIRECYLHKKDEYSMVKTQLIALQRTIEKLERNDFMPNYNVELKTMPRRNVASLRDVISRYEQEGELWKKLYSYAAKNQIKLSSSCLPVSVYMDSEYKDEHPDIEVQVCVEGNYKDTDSIHFKEIKEMQVASVTFSGGYEQISDIYRSMAEWMETNQYVFDGNMFLVYITSPSETMQTNNLVSELCIPVKKL